MTPKEKAKELVDKFNRVEGHNYDCEYIETDMAFDCALICADEVLKTVPFVGDFRNYWNEVKQEINKL